jgi:outer membrane lipoprotein LolB
MIKGLKLAASISLIALLAGCQQPIWVKKPVDTPETKWQQRAQQLENISAWRFDGRTVITQDKEGWNANIRWWQKYNAYSIKLSGPFAQGGVLLKGDGTEVVMTTADGQMLSASSPEALLKENLGLDMPVSALRDWVRGMPYDEIGVDEVKYDELGHITFLKQKNWQIEFKRYIPFQTYSMPAKVFIRNDSLSMRLVIADWSEVK